ncbi:unnamed protein product (macronuclear) [Paramecium tetraurelia]|uniref:Uncharacterized protein n=1 Tax=Paramecium tetraurelia TaxID=5888 RepID=A0BD20_PARTE|nr:uncharacterized protein GSPATT00004531001 [Paramecium tetraurelia]CAK56437.1 unnamed protein product [Paramecium tetraurelia]|eukprot:XP_001423835.1 hypothetical protein (macronuclear) [Paramecium tetraurelia strain d4-2]
MSFKNTQQYKDQKFTNHLNDCEAISEIKVKLENVPENPAQLDDQAAELIESQSQIKFFLEELDNKQQDEFQQEIKDDEAEEYEPILNTQTQVDQKLIYQQQQQQKQKQIETFQQVKEKLQSRQTEPLPSDNKLNQDIIQDDIDISQSKLCKSLLKNINDQGNNEDTELIAQLYSELNEMRQRNKEMQIQKDFYQSELKRVQEQYQKDLNKQKQIFENEIASLKAQINLAKKVTKQETQNLTTVTFQERQVILKDLMNKIKDQQDKVQEGHSNFNEKPINHTKQNNEPILNPQTQNQKVLQVVDLEHEKLKDVDKALQKEELQQADKKKKNAKQQESPQKQKIAVEKQVNPPPPKKSTKQVRNTNPEIKQDQQKLAPQMKAEKQNESNRDAILNKQTAENPDDFFNRLSNQSQQIGQDQQVVFQNQKNQINQTKEDHKEENLNQAELETSEKQKKQEILQNPIDDNLLSNEKNSQLAQQDPFSQNHSQIQNQNSVKAQKQIPKQRRINQGGNSIQNVPSSLFD